MVTGLATAAGIGIAGYVTRDQFDGHALSPVAALERMNRGDITLIDIRRPEEWAATGIADGAVALDMRRADFVAALTQILEGDIDRPIAIICARGVRSDRMSARLSAAGFTTVIDIPEGMMGSSAGPGWLKRGLPVQAKPIEAN
jgi:rhodanese-related sulfurtransferase